MVTGSYKGLNRLKWLQEGMRVERGYKGLQGVTGGYRGLQGVTSGYKGSL